MTSEIDSKIREMLLMRDENNLIYDAKIQRLEEFWQD